jgi:hypothetical protein
MGMGQGESGTNGESCSEVADRPVEISLAREGPSKVVPRLDVARIDAHRFSSALPSLCSLFVLITRKSY